MDFLFKLLALSKNREKKKETLMQARLLANIEEEETFLRKKNGKT
jgi:hypothetical protein